MTGKRRKGRDPVRPTPPPPPATPPTPPVARPETVTVAPRVSRRQARQERKRQQRRRIGFAGGAAIVVAAVIILGLVAFGVNKAVTSSGSKARTQTTVLFQIEGAGSTAAASALLAHDSDQGDAVEVLVPGRVITDVCGYNTLNFDSILALPNGAANSRQALSGMLGGITIDGSWVLTQSQLSRLIDRLGGITVDVDTNVVQHTGGGGGRILVPAGNGRHLTGAQALEYATYSTSPNAAAAAQLARLQRVIDATAQALPRTSTAIAALIRQLGPGADSTLGSSRLSTFLLGFAAAERASGKLLPIDLPTTSIDSGGAPSYRIDAPRAQALVRGSFAGSEPAGTGSTQPRVELLNGVGTPGLIATACPKLASHGLAYAGSTNASTFDNPRSTIAVPTSDIALGYRVADALGLPHSDVRRSSSDQSVADAIVTLGRDYRP